MHEISQIGSLFQDQYRLFVCLVSCVFKSIGLSHHFYADDDLSAADSVRHKRRHRLTFCLEVLESF